MCVCHSTYDAKRGVLNVACASKCSRASVLETLLTAQTRLVLPTAIHTEDRGERSTQTDRHENIDASKWRLEHRTGWGLVTNLQRPLPAQRHSLRTGRDTDSRGRTVAEG